MKGGMVWKSLWSKYRNLPENIKTAMDRARDDEQHKVDET